jgi:hypothetical protein
VGLGKLLKHGRQRGRRRILQDLGLIQRADPRSQSRTAASFRSKCDHSRIIQAATDSGINSVAITINPLPEQIIKAR